MFVERATGETLLVEEAAAECLQACVNRLESCVVGREGGGVGHEFIGDSSEAGNRGIKEREVKAQTRGFYRGLEGLGVCCKGGGISCNIERNEWSLNHI